MIPELNLLELAIEKKRRHGKRRACSAGIDEIRECLKEYKAALEKSRWRRFVAWLRKHITWCKVGAKWPMAHIK